MKFLSHPLRIIVIDPDCCAILRSNLSNGGGTPKYCYKGP